MGSLFEKDKNCPGNQRKTMIQTISLMDSNFPVSLQSRKFNYFLSNHSESAKLILLFVQPCQNNSILSLHNDTKATQTVVHNSTS